MILKVFSVYDSKALGFHNPWYGEAVGAAVRAFADASNDAQCPYSKHPGDYQLYEIGSFDNVKGVFTSLVPHKLLGCAADFVEVRKSGLNLPAGVSFPVQEVVENGSKKS